MMKLTTIKAIIASVLLLIIVIISIVPQKRLELFEMDLTASQNAPSSQTVYQSSPDMATFDSTISQIYSSLYDYQMSMMVMKRCYGIPIAKIEDIFNNTLLWSNLCVDKIGIYTNDFNDVENKIFQALLTFATNQPTNLIKGDVYVLLTQQPYYRNTDGTPISLDSTTINSRNNYNPPKYTNKSVADVDAQPIYYEVYVIYASYKNDRSYDPCTDHFKPITDSFDANFYSKENQCFMTCIGNSTKLCGCGTSASNTASQQSQVAAITANTAAYDSMCLGPQLLNSSSFNTLSFDKSKPKILPTSYYILYIINQNYKNTYDMTKIFDLSDTCKMVNNMPSTDPLVMSQMRYPTF